VPAPGVAISFGRAGARPAGAAIGHVARKVLHRLHAVAAQRAHGHGVGAGRAAQAQVDAAGVQLGQGAEGLGHHQRRVVGQHHAAGADADALGAAGDVAHQHGRGRGGDADHVVVLGHPVAREAQALDMPRRGQRHRQRIGHRPPLAHGHQIEHGKGDILQGLGHAPIVRDVRQAGAATPCRACNPFDSS
jgi:hypothetical protein